MLDKLLKGDLFFSRSVTKRHTARIDDVHAVSASSTLYDMSFRHHILDRPYKAHYKDPDSDLTSQKVTHVFHANDAHFKLYAGWGGNSEVAIDEFFHEFSRSPISPDSETPGFLGPNRLVALIGKVGTGKSTFISHLLVCHYGTIRRESILAFRVDVEEFAGRDVAKDRFFKNLFLKVQDEVRREYQQDRLFWKDEFEAVTPALVSHDVDIAAGQYIFAIKAIFIALRQRFNARGVIFLDNVDKYYYLFDRAAFSVEGAAMRKAGMTKLQQILVEFSAPAGQLNGAALCVLVTLRRHTLHYLQAGNFAAPNGFLKFSEILGHSVFLLKSPSAEEVIESRMNLIRRVAKFALPLYQQRQVEAELDKVVTIWREVSDPSVTRRQRSRRMLDDLARFMHHGHRSLMEHLQQYSWAIDDVVSFTRIFRSYSPSILLYMLGNRQRYSQVECRFPNLFLVRGEMSTGSGEVVPERLRGPHRQTYWLKYLVLRYIHSQKQRGQHVSREDLISVFCRDSVESGYYESHVLELVLGSLCQVDGSCCIDPQYGTDLEGSGIAISDILLTSRGEFLIERFSFDFVYLQLIIEDYMLELPSGVGMESGALNFDLPDGLNYGYLVARFEDYAAAAASMVKFKARLVANFLIILDVALEIEVERRAPVFRLLKLRSVELPNFSKVRAELAESIARVLTQLREDDPAIFASEVIESAERNRLNLVRFFRSAYLDHDV